MPKEQFVFLHNQNNQHLWEKLPNNHTISDLDKNRIKEIVRLAISEKRLPESAISASIPEILKKLQLLNNNQLNNAAVVLFCKKEDKQFMQSEIKLARFKGLDKSEFIDNKRFRANAFDLFDKAFTFLTSTLPVAAYIEENNPIRVEKPAIPYSVLREALTNALVHRDYSNNGGSIAIAVYDDRLNITNTGALPPGVKLSELSKEHPSRPRNLVIADVFYLCGKIEKWGRGTLDIIQDSRKAGNPNPIYEEVGGSFSITLPFREPIRKSAELPTEQEKSHKLSERQQQIIDLLKAGPLDRDKIRDRLRLPIADRTMQLELSKLKRLGLIKSIGGSKNTVWVSVD